MKKKMSRLFSGVLAAVMAIGMLPAYAELDVGADVDVVDNQGTSQAAVIDSAPAQFNVIVPTKLPFAILANNETLKATNAAIKNQGNGPVKLAGITAEGKGWAFADYDSVDFNVLPMNSKVFTMQLNGDKVPASAVDTKVNVPITQSAWASGAEGSIYGKTDLPISYDGKFAPQADASEEAVVAHVVFTIGWQTADDTNNGGDNQNNENDPVTNPDEKLAKPSFTTDATTFIYDGQPHFPDISTNDGIVLGGETTPKTNVGSYTTTITPADGYAWDDGTKTPVTVEWEIKKADAAVDEAPTAKTLTYTGSAQELVNAGSTTGGTMQYKLDNGAWGTAIPTATDAGNYTVSYKVVGGNGYNDIAEKSIVVNIAKKATTMSLSTTSVSLNANTTSEVVTVTTDGDGKITASSSDTNIATVSVSGREITLKSNGNTDGSVTVTIFQSSGANYAATSKTIQVNVKFALTAYTSPQSGISYIDGVNGLNEIQVSEIAKAISNNSAITHETAEVWVDTYNRHISIGDIGDYVYGSGHAVKQYRIIGFNHYDLTSPNAYGSTTKTGKAGILVQTVDSLERLNIDANNKATLGWNSSAARNQLNGNGLGGNYGYFLRKSVLKQVKIKSATSVNNETLVETSDYLFLPAEVEIFGQAKYALCGNLEGTQYAWYKFNNTNECAQRSGDWWTRSACSYDSIRGNASWCLITNSGEISTSGPNFASDYYPCFNF